jgi:hypothetical protein
MHTNVCRPTIDGKKVFQFPQELVLHSLRHTFLTRMGEAGADAFTIMKVANHSSVTMSQRYIHPMSGTVELTFEWLEKFGQKVLEASDGSNLAHFSIEAGLAASGINVIFSFQT